MNLAHQDWKTQVVHKNTNAKSNASKNQSYLSKTDKNLLSDTPQKQQKFLKISPLEIMQIRQRNSWTQKNLAMELNLTVQVVAAWEQGKASPAGATLAKLRALQKTSLRPVA